MAHLRTETPVYSREVGLDMWIAYSGNNAIYIGEAYPGALVSEAKWRIQKLAYDGSGNMVTKRWANSLDDFVHIWDNRTTYSYGDI